MRRKKTSIIVVQNIRVKRLKRAQPQHFLRVQRNQSNLDVCHVTNSPHWF